MKFVKRRTFRFRFACRRGGRRRRSRRRASRGSRGSRDAAGFRGRTRAGRDRARRTRPDRISAASRSREPATMPSRWFPIPWNGRAARDDRAARRRACLGAGAGDGIRRCARPAGRVAIGWTAGIPARRAFREVSAHRHIERAPRVVFQIQLASWCK